MREFNYTIKDEVGIHARPAGMLAKKTKLFESEITITKNGRTVDASKLIAVMGLGVKYGDSVTVSANGADEDEAIKEMEKFFAENL